MKTDTGTNSIRRNIKDGNIIPQNNLPKWKKESLEFRNALKEGRKYT
jgi:hypothetical protein